MTSGDRAWRNRAQARSPAWLSAPAPPGSAAGVAGAVPVPGRAALAPVNISRVSCALGGVKLSPIGMWDLNGGRVQPTLNLAYSISLHARMHEVRW